jgi:hypothetical protein
MLVKFTGEEQKEFFVEKTQHRNVHFASATGLRKNAG